MSLVMVINAEMSAKLYCMKEPISMRTTKREGKPEVPSDVSTIKRFFFSDTLQEYGRWPLERSNYKARFKSYSESSTQIHY